MTPEDFASWGWRIPFLSSIVLIIFGLWVRLLKVPYRLLFTTILVFCCIGIYSINNNPADVYLTAFFGFAGYAFIKLGLEPAPLLLGYVLGPLMEEYLRRAMLLSRGDPTVFFTRPISLAFMVATAAVLVLAYGAMAGRRSSGTTTTPPPPPAT